MRRHVRTLDRRIGTMIAKLPASYRPLMLFATLLGQPPFTHGPTLAVIIYGFMTTNDLFITAGTVALVSIVVSNLLKLVLRRARPDNDYVKNMLVKTFSFPSGHAANSLVSFGLLVYLFAPLVGIWALPIAVLAGLLCFAIGASRVYLGAHYPSDVLGGWLIGAIGVFAMVVLSA